MVEDKMEDSLDDRRFGGVARLYGLELREHFRHATVVVAGLGGVGSWAAEALARSAIGHLVLIDFDHIAESNTNRQLHALEGQYGKAKVEAMTQRILQINPEIKLTPFDEFLTPENLDLLIPSDALVLDATDSVQTKIALSVWAVKNNRALLITGTIIPNSNFVEHINVEQRRLEYIDALVFYSSQFPNDDLFFLENSAYNFYKDKEFQKLFIVFIHFNKLCSKSSKWIKFSRGSKK